ncbi:MAG: hypothetical protein AB8G96_07065 [Phycisphaerales bacterium]
MASVRLLVCPYCGDTQPPGDVCRRCRGAFDEESRRASLNAMGPWFLRDPRRPFLPGCSYETMVQRAERGELTGVSIIRGPTTKQLWAAARRVPAIAHLVGYCHACDASVARGSSRCAACNAVFGAWMDRNQLGLPDIQLLDGSIPIPEPAKRTTALARRVPMRASAVHRTRPAGRVPGLTLDMDPPKTSGTWTAIVGGLVVALVLVILVPVGIGIVRARGNAGVSTDDVVARSGDGAAADDGGRSGDENGPGDAANVRPMAGELPAGTFRPTAPINVPESVAGDRADGAAGIGAPADAPVTGDDGDDIAGGTAAEPDSEAFSGRVANADARVDPNTDPRVGSTPESGAPAGGESASDADADAGADANTDAGPSTPRDADDRSSGNAAPGESAAQAIRRLRALALDDARPWTQRASAWREAAGIIMDTPLAPGETLPMSIDVVRSGFDRTLVDAFARGASVDELLAADRALEDVVGPAPRR